MANLVVNIQGTNTGAWSSDGGTTWNDSGDSVALADGDHTITFRDVNGFDKPNDIDITMATGVDQDIDVNYVVAPLQPVPGGPPVPGPGNQPVNQPAQQPQQRQSLPRWMQIAAAVLGLCAIAALALILGLSALNKVRSMWASTGNGGAQITEPAPSPNPAPVNPPVPTPAPPAPGPIVTPPGPPAPAPVPAPIPAPAPTTIPDIIGSEVQALRFRCVANGLEVWYQPRQGGSNFRYVAVVYPHETRPFSLIEASDGWHYGIVGQGQILGVNFVDSEHPLQSPADLYDETPPSQRTWAGVYPNAQNQHLGVQIRMDGLARGSYRVPTCGPVASR